MIALILLHSLQRPLLYLTSHDFMMLSHNNYVSGALSLEPIQLFSIEVSRFLSRHNTVNIYQLSLTCNLALLQLISDMLSEPVECRAWRGCIVSPLPPPPDSLFIGQHTHVVAPQRH